jgi:hypothetical protein
VASAEKKLDRIATVGIKPRIRAKEKVLAKKIDGKKALRKKFFME